MLFLILIATLAQSPQCASATECAQMAAEAIAQARFETSHDLAWRAVQLGPRNDPTLMYLLARTQSLSGRPDDSLVMLRRLAALGFRTEDVETLEDFRRVRALAEWPDVLAALRGAPTTSAPAVEKPAAAPPVNSARDDGLAVPASVVSPVALAYDAVSDRFVVVDEYSDTLKVVDERTGNAVALVSPGWSGTHRPSALAIDPRRGDLWAAGVDTTSGTPRSALYKLQLVSGRLLQTFPLPDAVGPARVIGLAVGRGTVFLLDDVGRRVFSLANGASGARVVANLVSLTGPASIAAASDAVIYVAHAKGLARVDLTARTRLPIAIPSSADVSELRSISWHEGSLFAIQRDSRGHHVALRIRLDASGLVATAVETLGPAASSAGGVYGGVFYYLATGAADGGMVVRSTRGR